MCLTQLNFFSILYFKGQKKGTATLLRSPTSKLLNNEALGFKLVVVRQ
jgi:hypothetical protein